MSDGRGALDRAQAVAVDGAGNALVAGFMDGIGGNIEDWVIRRLDAATGGVLEFSGTGGGFKKFAAGETDISNASRPILKAEMAECAKAGIEYYELPVAFDALTVVVNPKNGFIKQLTVAEMKKMWEPAAQGKVTRWNQVNSSWPDAPMKRNSLGTGFLIEGGFVVTNAHVVGDAGVDTPFRLHGIPQEFLGHAKRAAILERIGLTPQALALGIVEDVTALGEGRSVVDVEHTP